MQDPKPHANNVTLTGKEPSFCLVNYLDLLCSSLAAYNHVRDSSIFNAKIYTIFRLLLYSNVNIHEHFRHANTEILSNFGQSLQTIKVIQSYLRSKSGTFFSLSNVSVR